MRPIAPRTLLANAALALALAALASGCAQKPTALTCSTHAECPSGSTCQHGVCQVGLALELTAPAAAVTYTNGSVPCQVTVTGATPGAVQLVVDDVPMQTLAAPYAGSLGTAGLGEGSHTLVAVTESGGRTYVSAPRTIVVDRTLPAAPAIAAATTNAADPVTVAGIWTTDGGAPVTITVYEGATALASGIVPGVGGAWTAGVSLSEGTHPLTARAVDAAGNASAPSGAATITVDRTLPPVPAVTAAVTNAADPVTVSGTIAADAGTPVTVTVYEGATVKQAGIVPSGTTWTATFALGEGSHGLTARAFDAAGNASAPCAVATVLVDRTLPAAPVVTSTYTNAADPVTVAGTWAADAGAPVTLTVYEGATALASGIVPVGGAWTASFALGEGSHALTARALDSAGNVSNLSAAGTVWVDRTVPAAPAVNAATTNAANPVTVSGSWTTGDAGTPVTIAIYEGATQLAAGLTPSAGAWSGAVTLGEGSHSLTARATDAAGNVSALSPAATVAVDRTAPPVPAIAALTTNAANPVTVSGTIAADGGTAVTVTVLEGATVLRSGIVPSGTTWSGTVSLAEGTHSLTVRSSDAAGNQSAASIAAAVVIDRTMPAAPAVSSTSTNAANPVPVSGTLTPDSGTAQTVSLYEGATLLASGIVPTGTAWTTSVALAEGSHSLTARAYDSAGNVSNLSGAGTVWVDRTVPAAPAVNAATTNAANPITVSGGWTTADTGSPVTISIYESATQLAAGITPSAGAWSGPVTLGEGSHSLTARAIDAAGNASALSGAAVVAVDRTAPPVPTIAALTTGAANPVTVSGTIATDAGTALLVVVYEGATVLNAGVAPSGTSWSAPVSLAEGNHSLTVRSVDAAGNTSALSTPANVVVDRSMPAAPTVTSTYTSAADPVPISGTLTPDSGTGLTISVYEGASLRASGIVPSGTSWTTSLILSEGSHSLTARAVDAAGNASNPSSAGTVWVDRTSPVAPAVTAGTTNATNPVTVTGTWTTADTGSPVTITLYEGATVLASGVTPSAGTWSAGVTLSEASHSLTARATDAAGNASSLSSPATVVVDRTLPPVPTINALTTNVANPVTVTGTIATDAGTAVTVTVYEGGTVLRSGVVPSGTAWSTTVTLTEGTHSLTVRSFDAAGNQSGLSPAASVVVDRTTPATPTVTSVRTNQANPVTVSGTWVTNDTGTPVTLSVYEGATLLGSGIIPVAGTWSAAFTLSEGTHSITARAIDGATNQSPLSAAGTIIVDRTAPSVTGRTPAINATGVWSRDNVVVTFSEAIQASTINGTNVRVSSVSPAFDVAFSSMTLSGDGLTLTLVPDATSLPPVPSHVTITLSGLLDLAGNALPSTSWSWDYPDWVDAAPYYRGSYFGARHSWAPSPTGVLYDATVDGPYGVHVSSSTSGGAWTGLGQIATSTSGDPGIAVDSQGRPVVATVEGGTVVVRRYAAGAWTQLGTISATSPTNPQVGIDSQDRPIVLWRDGSSTYTVAGYRWSGTDWNTQIVPARTASGSLVYALVVKRDDTAASAYLTTSLALGASDVAMTRNLGGNIAGVAITQGSTGDDFIAYITTAGTVGVVTKLNAYPASSLTDFGPTLTGYAGSSAPGIAYRTVGPTTSRLFLSFRSSASRPVVYAWDGSSSWVSITGSLTSAGTAIRDVELAVTPAGQLYVAWWEIQNADWYALFIKKYNR